MPLDITPASLSVHCIISVSGAAYPFANTTSSGAGQGLLLGEIRMFAGTRAPQGWDFCDGQVLPINANEALFSLLGNTYGGGTTIQDSVCSDTQYPGILLGRMFNSNAFTTTKVTGVSLIRAASSNAPAATRSKSGSSRAGNP